MNRPKIMLLFTLLALLVGSGCARKERLLENLYEGVQMQNRQAAPPGAELPPPTGYDEYQRQRREVVQGAPEKP